MKILIDARLYGLENAGLGRYVMNLVASLEKMDKENSYIILLRKKYYDSFDLPSNFEKVLADFRHYSFTEQFKLPLIIKNKNPDITHFPHFNIPVMYSGKFVVTIHDLLMHTQKGADATTLTPLNYFIKRFGYHLGFAYAVKKSKKIIVPTISVKNELIRYYHLPAEKIIVTYEGVDKIKVVDSGPKVQEPYFVYAGNAYPHKNLKRLIQAIVLLNINYNRTVTLALASARNNFTERLQKMIKECNAEKFVKLLGFVEDKQMGDLLSNSEAFVFPSLSEGFGIPGLEAMSAGTLLLASEIPVFKEVYKDNAFYFNQLDFNSIERVMRMVIDLPKDYRLKKIETACEFVKRYSWDKMAKETLEVYKTMVK